MYFYFYHSFGTSLTCATNIDNKISEAHLEYFSFHNKICKIFKQNKKFTKRSKRIQQSKVELAENVL